MNNFPTLFCRHLATHDTEPETECSCNDCTGNDKKDLESSEVDQEKDPLDIRASPRKKSAAASKGNLLKKMQSLFNATENEASDDDIDEENDSDDDEALKPYECAICPGAKFSTVEGLGKHVESSHSKETSPTTLSSPSSSSPKKAKKVQSRSKEITEEVIDEVTDEFANEVANIEAKSMPKSTKNPKLQTQSNGMCENSIIDNIDDFLKSSKHQA